MLSAVLKISSSFFNYINNPEMRQIKGFQPKYFLIAGIINWLIVLAELT